MITTFNLTLFEGVNSECLKKRLEEVTGCYAFEQPYGEVRRCYSAVQPYGEVCVVTAWRRLKKR